MTEGAPVSAPRVQETSTTTGTGTYDLGGAVATFEGFVAALGSGARVYYVAGGAGGLTDWEVGVGTVTDASPDTLTRDRVIASSNADAAVSWAAGTKRIYATAPVEMFARCVAPRYAQTAHGLAAGEPVYLNGANWAKAGSAEGAGNGLSKLATGVVAAVPDADSLHVCTHGLLELATADWDAVKGGSGGLSAGSIYWLSTTDGDLVVDKPPFPNWPQAVVVALSSTLGFVLPAIRSEALAADPSTQDGRLSLSSSDPAPTDDQLTKATLYYLPHNGNHVALWDTSLSRWKLSKIPDAGVSITDSGLTFNTNYDVFAYLTGGALTLELVAWASDSARATALARQDGVLSKTGALGRRYLGTVRYALGYDRTKPGLSVTGTFTASGGNAALIDDDTGVYGSDAVVASDLAFRVDFGSGVTKHIRALRVSKEGGTGFTNAITCKLEWSDDDAAWTQAGSNFVIAAGTATAFENFTFAASGEHRYWRFAYVSGTTGGAGNIREVEFLTEHGFMDGAEYRYVWNLDNRERFGLLPHAGGASPYVKLQDVKASGTNGGTFTSGAWQTRTLNTKWDPHLLCSLSSNQFTLRAGKWRIRAWAPAFNGHQHQARLFNVTDSLLILTGMSQYTQADGTTAVTQSVIVGEFVIAASKALELQHRCATTGTTSGFGAADSFGDEVYARVELEFVEE